MDLGPSVNDLADTPPPRRTHLRTSGAGVSDEFAADLISSPVAAIDHARPTVVIDLAAPMYSPPPRYKGYDRGSAESALEAFQRDGDWRDAVAAIVYSLLAAEAQLERIWGQL
jgi:hypothetical protein